MYLHTALTCKLKHDCLNWQGTYFLKDSHFFLVSHLPYTENWDGKMFS